MSATVARAPGTGPAVLTRLTRLTGRGRAGPVHVAVALTLLAGVGLRVYWVGPLWLDEAQSVAISRLPLAHGLFAALRRDGSPPLYYLLLHFWMLAFGSSTLAVRALSSVFALASLPVGYLAARRLAGPRIALLALLALAASPFAIRYATETRMYTLELLLVLLGALVLPRALEQASPPRLAAVTVLTALLAYSHYWALFLLAVVAALLAAQRRWRVLAAMAGALVLFAPWLPSLLYQLRYTGTPWASAASPSDLVDTVLQWAGPGWEGELLAVATLLLAGLGLVARRSGDEAVLELHSDPVALRAALLYAGPLVLAALAAAVVTSGYAVRYTAVVLPPFLLLVAFGLARLPPRAQLVATALLVVLGLWGGFRWLDYPRTQAGTVAAVLRAQARPGDVVAVCPDQLGPALARELPARLGLVESAFADPTGPALVDWVDYAQRMAATPPTGYARRLLVLRPPGGTVWLVWQDGYRTLGNDCDQIAATLADALGPGVQLVSSNRDFEHENLTAFAPAPR